MFIRNKAFFIHLSASGTALALLTIYLFVVWYAPWPLLSIQGGLKILGLLIAVDLILGPALTWLVFKPDKSKRMLIFDLSVIVLVQLAALSYGTWAMYNERPLFLAFVQDRFEVARAADLNLAQLNSNLMPENYRGARPVQVDLPSSPSFEMMLAPLATGQTMSLLSQYYRPFPGNEKMKQLAVVAKNPPSSPNGLQGWLSSHKLELDQVLLFPVIGQNGEATAVVSRENGELMGLLNETW